MSQQNVEVVQEVLDAYFRGDEAGMLALFAPDVVATQFPDQLDVRDYHGPDGVRRVMADWLSTWDDWAIEISSVRDLGDRVLVAARQRGRGKASGAPFEGDVVFVFTVRRAVVTRWQMFRNEPEALKAVAPEE